MSDDEPLDRLHLLSHAQALFPSAVIDVIYTPDELIYIHVDGHRYSFEIGSDDDFNDFSDGQTNFRVPLLENPEDM